jgi:SAM-dependent methyltransferase
MTLPPNFSKIFCDKGKSGNSEFFLRLNLNKYSFKNLKILEVGCGYGSLCIDLVKKGTKKIIGIDVNKRIVEYATENLLTNYSFFKNNIDFKCCCIEDLPLDKFDVIISKNTLEHILDVQKFVEESKKRLKQNGKIIFGFGPLYYSPYGDHEWTKAIIPWGHLILPESFLLKRVNKHSKKNVCCITEIKDGLNKLSLKEYKNIFFNCGLQVLLFKVNQGKSIIKKICNCLRKIPFLEEFFSLNIYCILRKL